MSGLFSIASVSRCEPSLARQRGGGWPLEEEPRVSAAPGS